MFRHPKEVCMTYTSHLKLSLKLSNLFLRGSAKAFVHGIIPDLYITSSSDTVKKIHDILKQSGCR